MKHATQISIIKDLLLQNVISEEQYKDFTRNEEPKIVQCNEKANHEQRKEDDSGDKEVEALRTYILKEGREEYVLWLQDVLLEFCYAKLLLGKAEKFEEGSPTVEPTIYYNCVLNMPLPLVHWTTEQSVALKFPPFVLLLHKLGFYLPAHTGKLFVRIPNFWTVGVIYGKAQQLGPINRDHIKFDVLLLEGTNKEQTAYPTKLTENDTRDHSKFVYDSRETPYLFRYTPLPNDEWKPTLRINSSFANNDLNRTQELNIVIPEQESSFNLDLPHTHRSSAGIQNSRLLSIMEYSNAIEEADRESICESASSGLTGMCVSDEENATVWSVDQKYL